AGAGVGEDGRQSDPGCAHSADHAGYAAVQDEEIQLAVEGSDMADGESNGDDRFAHLEKSVLQLEKSLSALIENVSNSLHREIHDGFRTVNERLDRMESRLDRHGGMLA